MATHPAENATHFPNVDIERLNRLMAEERNLADGVGRDWSTFSDDINESFVREMDQIFSFIEKRRNYTEEKLQEYGSVEVKMPSPAYGNINIKPNSVLSHAEQKTNRSYETEPHVTHNSINISEKRGAKTSAQSTTSRTDQLKFDQTVEPVIHGKCIDIMQKNSQEDTVRVKLRLLIKSPDSNTLKRRDIVEQFSNNCTIQNLIKFIIKSIDNNQKPSSNNSNQRACAERSVLPKVTKIQHAATKKAIFSSENDAADLQSSLHDFEILSNSLLLVDIEDPETSNRVPSLAKAAKQVSDGFWGAVRSVNPVASLVSRNTNSSKPSTHTQIHEPKAFMTLSDLKKEDEKANKNSKQTFYNGTNTEFEE